MNWFKRKVAEWATRELREEAAYSNQTAGLAIPKGLSSRNNIGSNNNKLHFAVYKAQGGHVVEFNHYDQKTDRHYEALHIITDQEDFAKELGNIVFMECLQR
jgi:hypothetical protein